MEVWMTRNLTEFQADTEIDGSRAFEQGFEPLVVHELMLEFHPRKAGPPVVVFTGNGGEREVHPAPQRGRPGRYLQRMQGDEAWTGVRITMARGKTGKLVKVMLVGKPPE
jgi:hypothetical protein